MPAAIYTEQVKRWNDKGSKPDARLLEPSEYATIHTPQDPRSSAAEVRITEVRKGNSTETVFRIKPLQLDVDGELVISLPDLEYVLDELIPE